MDFQPLLEPEDKARELRKIVISGEAVAFVGSGLSVGCYPGWKEAVETLCDRCGITASICEDPDDLIEKAEECKKENEAVYYNTLEELFGKSRPLQRATYDYLLRLPFKSYITTNIDPLLYEKRDLFRPELGRHVYPDLLLTRAERGAIFYIHGIANTNYTYAPRELVFASSEFKKAYEESSILPSFLVQLLLSHPIVFLGCSLSEPPLKRILKRVKQDRDWIGGSVGRNPPKLFIMLRMKFRSEKHGEKKRDLEEEYKEDQRYREFGLTIVRYNPQDEELHSGLDKALEEWCEFGSRRPSIGWGDNK